MARVVVEVLEGKNLSGSNADAFCIVSIPGSNFRSETKTVKNSTHPTWSDRFDFRDVDITNQEANTLNIEVRDGDFQKKDNYLGKCNVALESLKDDKLYHVWLKLKEGYGGEVRVKITVSRHTEVAATSSPQSHSASEIIAYCKRHDCLFEDKEFIAGDFALYKDGQGPHTKYVKWKRPGEFCSNPRLFVDGVEAGDVIQGALGDCYFLGALSVVATRKDLLEPLFVSAHPEYGFYQIKFFKNNEWVVVTIDDRLPCNGNVPIYSHCKDVNELWVPLVEKAYAKLHRCYEVLEAGSIAAALADLTGESTQTFAFDDQMVVKSMQDGSFWKEVKYFAEESFLMGCSYQIDGVDAEGNAGHGILQNHAYGVLNVAEPKSHQVSLMEIRNPWGRLEWTGRFSDGDLNWTPELIQELKVNFADDGGFYMCFEDFIRHYNQLIVLRLLTDNIGKQWQKQVFEGEWKGKNAGGSTNNPTWRNNQQYGITVTVPDTKIFVSLSQPDARMRWEGDYAIPIGLHLLRTTNSQVTKTSLTNDDIITKVNYYPSRDASISATLPVGEYIVFPSTYEPGMESKYWLTFYSEEPIHVAPIKPDLEYGIKSEWKSTTAGGCHNNQTWVYNPKFVITALEEAQTPVRLTVILRQPDKKPFQHIGMYNGKWTNQAIDKTLCRGAKPCLNMREISFSDYILPGDWPRFVIPHTFHPSIESTFELYAQCSVPVKIERLPC